jgi:hypothetical protein
MRLRVRFDVLLYVLNIPDFLGSARFGAAGVRWKMDVRIIR